MTDPITAAYRAGLEAAAAACDGYFPSDFTPYEVLRAIRAAIRALPVPEPDPMMTGCRALPSREDVARAIYTYLKANNSSSAYTGDGPLDDVILDGQFDLFEVADAVLALMKGETK